MPGKIKKIWADLSEIISTSLQTPNSFCRTQAMHICLHCIGSVFASFAKRYGPSVNSFGPRPSIALVFSCKQNISDVI